MNTIESVWNLVDPIAKKLQLEIWDVHFLKEGSNWYLRIFIDSPNGITIDDCERFSRAIDQPLDDLDPINVGYCLEVSSPGIERRLTRPEHFQKYIDEKVVVNFIRPIDQDVKEISAKLKKFENSQITLELENKQTLCVNKKNLAYVKLDNLNF